MHRFLFALLLLPFWTLLQAQPVYPYRYPVQRGAAELHEDLRRLQVLGSALFVAAHPDDENTRLIAWLAGERKVRTTYLSLTRGDGGQNLIGPEIRDLLGVLRTQELLMARGVDRGEQRFSRANDFGYSKTPDETFAIWDREAVLADAVWTIRQTRPDIIVNRFNHRTPGTTHGHHTASAIIALEAFEMAGDPNAFPEQLAYVKPWKPSRIFFNTSWWFYGSREAFEEADKSNMVAVNVGAYNEARGLSYTEIAARSRSQHKCQGFGSTGTRGNSMEYLEFLDGEALPEGASDPFSGLNISWNRLRGGSTVADLLVKADAAFDPDDPAACVPLLLEAHAAMERLNADPRVMRQQEACADLIRSCLGLWFEAIADRPLGVAGDSLRLALEMVPRSGMPITVESLRVLDARGREMQTQAWEPQGIKANEVLERNIAFQLPSDAPPSTAYWLLEEGTLGTFRVDDQLLRSQALSPAPLRVEAELLVFGKPLKLSVPVVYKSNDRVAGEVYRPFSLVAPATVTFDRPVYLFADAEASEVSVTIKAHRAGVSGQLLVAGSPGEDWTVEANQPFTLALAGEEQSHAIRVSPPAGSASGALRLELLIDGERYPYALATVAYDHIPEQTILMPSQATLARLDIAVDAKRIGYILGAGDDIPAALTAIGCEVVLLEDDDLKGPDLAERLASFDAVVAGIRAYNTRDRLAFVQEALMEYVEAGGTYVVQYNTNRGLVTDKLGPYPMELSRGRVTVEQAPISILAPEHPVMNQPNTITQADFAGWVQERGLYFPGSWDDNYTPILSSADPQEETALEGGLLVAQHGKGWYVYTGYSFFRELPAGVPGAFRLFANIVSLGN